MSHLPRPPCLRSPETLPDPPLAPHVVPTPHGPSLCLNGSLQLCLPQTRLSQRSHWSPLGGVARAGLTLNLPRAGDPKSTSWSLLVGAHGERGVQVGAPLAGWSWGAERASPPWQPCWGLGSLVIMSSKSHPERLRLATRTCSFAGVGLCPGAAGPPRAVVRAEAGGGSGQGLCSGSRGKGLQPLAF